MIRRPPRYTRTDTLFPYTTRFRSRRLGDLLIVAVNDDDSVRRLKGPSRPLNGVADRMALLASLRCVDFVVPFSEDTPERLISPVLRSERRGVGKERVSPCRSRWSLAPEKKKHSRQSY